MFKKIDSLSEEEELKDILNDLLNIAGLLDEHQVKKVLKRENENKKVLCTANNFSGKVLLCM